MYRASSRIAASGLTLIAAIALLSANASCKPEPNYDTQCESCHAPAGKSKIEDAHPAYKLSCVDCHGGDPDASSRAAAHINPPSDIDTIRHMATDELDEVPLDYLRFVNPGDLRVADEGCGSTNVAAEGGGCHQNIVDTNRLSVMSAFTGHYNVPRFLGGLQERDALYGSHDLVDLDFDAANAPPGAVESVTTLRAPLGDQRDDLETIMDNYLVKQCPTCHAYSFGLNSAPGDYRSSGCTSCHMVYENDGLSQSGDPTLSKNEPSHPARHELTTAIPETQCEHCHYQGARIGLSFQGIREGGFAEKPPNGTPLGEPRHRHDAEFYWVDEDDTNSIDETPPDLHFTAGMTCVDCHVGSDVHGDGWLYSTAKFQTGIKCEDCHGTVREAVVEGSDGHFHADAGHKLKQLSRNQSGVVILTGAMDGQEHLVKQVAKVLEVGSNPHMTEAMGVNGEGWSHTDSLECHACHSGWRQTCFGCHISMDDRYEASDHQSGQDTPGLVQGTRDFTTLTDYFLGTNSRGKVTSVCPSQQMFVTYYDEDGFKTVDERVRTTANGLLGFGWAPNNPHTTQRVPQNCDRCHIKPDESNTAEVMGTYGFGTGEYFLPDEDGVMHDLSKILDDMGIPIVDFAHEGAGAVGGDMLDNALQVRVEPQAR